MSEVLLKEQGITVHIITEDELDSGSLAVIASNAMDNALAERSIEAGEESSGVAMPPLKMSKPMPVKKEESTKVVQLPNRQQDRPVIRDRLPNEVRPGDYDLIQAETEKVLIRCPECGQAHAAIIQANGSVYVLEKLKGEFKPIMESQIGDGIDGAEFMKSVSKQDDETELDYYLSMQKSVPMDDNDFAVTPETEVFCPVCHKSNALKIWDAAWRDPAILGIEYNHVCDVCGGEMDSVPTAEGRIMMVCEHCGHKEALSDDNSISKR